MKFVYFLNLVTLAMAAPKTGEDVTLSGLFDTSDPFIQGVWDDAVSFKEGDDVKARAVEASGSGLERRACTDRRGFQLCLAACNTGCAIGCRCASCFMLCPGQCRGRPEWADC
ncbi:hypothetical protein F66182_494 [Fusarium sp. NRRL 66182]|nr:hypothetical protein F66182_494 [Fusarium sp. NRRL 66182]